MPTTLATIHGEVVLRAAHVEDVEAFRELRLEALRTHPEAFGADYATELARPLPYWTETLERAAGDTAVIILATHQQVLIGMAGVRRGFSAKTQHGGLIWGVYVRSAWRGHHIADALLAAGMEWARAQGTQQVKLAVVTTNVPAIRCYLRCGFSVYGVEARAIYRASQYYDELLMARPL
jgi:RimJ/RimL family protein N-acetyltransferase